MGFLARAVAHQKGQSVYERWMEALSIGAKSKAGPSVNLQSALKVSTALACMRVISQGAAQVPLKLFREREVDGLRRREVARDHDIYELITVAPNGWQTGFEFRETMAVHQCLGNAYAFKNKFRGKLLELILLDPGLVQPEQKDDWSITYKVYGRNGTFQEFSQDQIWHLRGLSWDGFMGLDTLKLAREALGLAIGLEESASLLHANGVQPSGTYSVEGALTKEQYENLSAWIKRHAAAERHAPLILDRGAKWLAQRMSSVDAQHREMRRDQVEEVCRFFGVLPIMIGHTGDKASTYASAEQMFLAHKIHTLDPIYNRIEQSADLNLLSRQERRQGYYFKHLANGLLRASTKERAEYLAKALGAGGHAPWMTQDEARAAEELDPFGGDAAVLPPRLGDAGKAGDDPDNNPA
jgi:HK97 family phage portal protein